MQISKKLVLGFTATFLLLQVNLSPVFAQEKPRNEDTYNQLKLFGEVFERVRADYVEEVTDKELIESAIQGMLSSLDPHSSFLNAEGFEEMRINTKGEFGGLGIEVTLENGLVKVVSPIDETPASRAGVEAGDYITHIDGKPILGLNLNEAVDLMRGPVGTEITITVQRFEEEPFELTLKRDIITVKSVRYRIEGNVGYLRITSFNEQVTDLLTQYVAEIREELGDDLIGFVLDLRNNPGGLLNEAISVSDAFLDKGEIVSTRGRHSEDSSRFNARKGDLAEGLPVVILINTGSASASEIVAGALQDHGRAIIMGTKSFGKGSVQTVIPLPGQGAMRLTTARYYTPSGRSIQATGIDPDIIVERARLESLEGRRFIEGEADLPGSLENDTLSDDDDQERLNISDAAREDYQLLRAIDLLKGLSLYSSQVTQK